MTITKNDIVYCDANFLIAYGASKVKQPDLKKRAYILFAKLLACECGIAASALTFDETWLGIRRELGPKKIYNRLRFFINKLFERIGVRLINYGASEFSYREICNDLNNFTDKLTKKDNFCIVQFNNPADGVIRALEYLRDYNLKPRDSFHLAIMKDNKISFFVSNDKHFNEIKERSGINIIRF